MNKDVFLLFQDIAPWIAFWIGGWLVVLVYRILHSLKHPIEILNEGTVMAELPGLPLILTHTACFFYSLYLMDWVSALLFGWWGPGFFYFAAKLVRGKIKKQTINWQPFAMPTSVACKVNYFLLVIAFSYYGIFEPLFCYSIWIMQDQVKLGWFNKNADRSRRLTEDYFIIRLGYPLFLFIPFFINDFAYREFAAALGGITFLLWVVILFRIVKHYDFFKKPDSKTYNLRDTVYLEKKPPADAV